MSSDRVKYVLLSGRHARVENGVNVRYTAGSEIVLTPAEVESLNKRGPRVERAVEPPPTVGAGARS